MIKVTIVSPEARLVSWTEKPGRSAGSMRVQEAWFHTLAKDGKPAPFPEKSEVRIEDGQDALAAGEYTLHPSSVYIDRNGRLALSPRLTPLQRKPA